MRLNKFLSGLAAVLLAFSLCNAASAAPLTKIRTAWMDSYETFAMWYAKEKGWDKEAGLDIDILFFDSGMAILNALPAGEWQYSCLGGVPAMMGNLRYGTSVIGVGTDESACVAVLARPDNPVFKTKGLNPKHPGVFGSPEDVRGKTILCTTVSSAHFALTAWLDAVGVKPTEVTIKNMDQPQALAAFENGIGDFVALWAPHMYAGTDKGWKVAGSAALCGKGTPLVLVADTKYADAHPEITAKFLSVYLRGVDAAEGTLGIPRSRIPALLLRLGRKDLFQGTRPAGSGIPPRMGHQGTAHPLRYLQGHEHSPAVASRHSPVLRLHRQHHPG